MRWLVVFGLLLSVMGAGRAQSPEVVELLQKVAATYGAIHDYEIAVQHHRTGGKKPIQTDHAADEAYTDPSVVLEMGAKGVPVARIVIARSGKKFYFQSGDAAWKEPSLWMTDGTTTWHYLHGLNKYTEEPAKPWPARPGESKGLPSIEWKYFGRFRVVDSMITRATLVKENVPASEVCPATTSIVDLKLVRGPEAATEELHVMARSGLVCEAIVHKRVTVGGRVEYFIDTTTWRYRSVAGDIDPKLFVFVPPKHAKRVRSFR